MSVLDRTPPNTPRTPQNTPNTSSSAPAFAAYRRQRASRAVLVSLVLAAVALALFVTTLCVGSGGVPPLDAIRSALHLGADPSTDFIVRELRLPRATTSLLVGLALGVSGAVFQRLLGNPLASPDILGVSSGAGTAAVAGLVLWNLAGVGVAGLALAGALATALAIYALAWRSGLSGYRFILVGIGVAAFLTSVTSYLVSKAEITDARAAMLWLTGSSGLAGPAQLWALGVGLVVTLPIAHALGRRLVVLELGDDAAAGLGVGVERDRRALMLVAVVLVALATAAAGPIAFVALMAGPIARRLLRGAGTGLAGAAAVGAILMLAADLVGQHALPATLPTGVVTGLVGAPYLVWLLISANRSGAGG